jgi:hypothetical protein
MNPLPNISHSHSTPIASVSSANPIQATMLSANQASASPLFMGSSKLPTEELAPRTLTLPPLIFSGLYETIQADKGSAEISLPMGPIQIGGIAEPNHELESAGKQVVLPRNHAPESWLSSDMNPVYMGPSPSLRNSHFIGGGSDKTTLSFLPDDLSPAVLQNLSRENLQRFEQIRDSYTTETQTIEIKEKDGSKGGRTVDVTVRKFNRPDPSTYLTKATINEHLSVFRDKPCLFLTRYAYDSFCKNGIGRKDGQFLIPKDIGDKIEKLLSNKSTFGAGEAQLGIPSGAWKNQEIIRVTVNEIPNLRMASGNEVGANNYWMPGGYLPNGLPEAVCDQIPNDKVTMSSFFPAD